MNRAARIQTLQNALDAVNAAIPQIQFKADHSATDRAEARATVLLISAENRRDDLAALIADMPDEGDLTELNPSEIDDLNTLQTTLDRSIRNNALLTATLEGLGQVLQTVIDIRNILA